MPTKATAGRVVIGLATHRKLEKSSSFYLRGEVFHGAMKRTLDFIRGARFVAIIVRHLKSRTFIVEIEPTTAAAE